MSCISKSLMSSSGNALSLDEVVALSSNVDSKIIPNSIFLCVCNFEPVGIYSPNMTSAADM